MSHCLVSVISVSVLIHGIHVDSDNPEEPFQVIGTSIIPEICDWHTSRPLIISQLWGGHVLPLKK